MTTLKSTLDVEAMQQRLDAAEAAWLDGERSLVTERLEAYVLRAAGCASARPQ